MAKVKINIYINEKGHSLFMTEKFEYERSFFNIGERSFNLNDSKIEKHNKFLPESKQNNKKNGKIFNKETFVLIGAPIKWLIENKYTLD